MAHQGRAQRFLFNPQEVVNSSAVLTMSGEAAGAYFRLFCRAWDMPTPGHLPDDDAVLASLSQAGHRWTAIRDEVVRAFVRDDVSGTLIISCMCESHSEQDMKRDKWRKSKERQRKAGGGQSKDVQGMSSVGSGSGSSAGSSAVESQNPCPISSDGELFPDNPRPKAKAAKKENPDAESFEAWGRFFERYVWPARPRLGAPGPKVSESKRKAAAAWDKHFPRGKTDTEQQDAANSILDALERDVAGMRAKGREGENCPHLATWLNGARWEDK